MFHFRPGIKLFKSRFRPRTQHFKSRFRPGIQLFNFRFIWIPGLKRTQNWEAEFQVYFKKSYVFSKTKKDKDLEFVKTCHEQAIYFTLGISFVLCKIGNQYLKFQLQNSANTKTFISQYFWKWTNVNPKNFFSRTATASKL